MFARLNHIATAGLLATTLAACATSTTPAAGASCDRACLSGAITTYMDALLAHDPSKLTLAETVKFTEDQVSVKVGESPLWKGATLPRDYRQDFIDVREGVAGSTLSWKKTAYR